MNSPSVESPSRRKRLDADTVTAISAVVIGVCALGVSVFQSRLMLEEQRLMREQQRASVWPRLQVGTSAMNGSFSIDVLNKGVGPATVKYVEVTVDQKPLSDWAQVLSQLTGGDAPLHGFATLGNQVLTAGEAVQVLGIRPGDDAVRVYMQDDRLGIRICYCSIYDECWWLTDPSVGAARSHSRVTPAEQCPTGGPAEFTM